MHRLLFAALLAFIGTSMLSGVYSGGGGMVDTVLAQSIGVDDTTVIADTTGFASKDIIQIENEKILYLGRNSTAFASCERGYDDTVAANHTAGRRIYTQESGVINNALGFNVGVEVDSSGSFALIQVPISFLTTTVPHLVKVNANFLKIPELAIIGLVFFVSGIALFIYLAIQIAPIAVSLVTGILGFIRGR